MPPRLGDALAAGHQWTGREIGNRHRMQRSRVSQNCCEGDQTCPGTAQLQKLSMIMFNSMCHRDPTF
jgi:hypothetical protein